MEETTTIERPTATPIEATAAAAMSASQDASSTDSAADSGAPAASGAFGWLKRGKAQSKPKPGKLPPRQVEQSRDSREAAADILREMTRRR
jgi:hypothetical protein